MTAQYKIFFKDKAGATVATITDYLDLAYGKRLNGFGSAAIQLKDSHRAIDALADKYQVEIHRRNAARGIDWYCDFYGFYRGRAAQYTDRMSWLGVFQEEKSLLDWRVIAYAAGVTGRTKFTGQPAETIAKALGTYNLTASGTTGDGRAKAATSSSKVNGYTVTIQADAAGGNSLDFYCADDTVLEALQKLARIGGGDFDLIKTAAATFQLRWYTGQRGSDLSATVTFSLERGNMRRPKLVYDRSGEKTSAIVGGGGEDSDRLFVTRTGADYSAADNDIETFVDARDLGIVTAALEDRGDQKLDGLRARRVFTWEAIQTDQYAYGKRYCIGGQMGDLINARFDGEDATQQIIGVRVAHQRGAAEQIKLEVTDV